jgi:hypothetical protein
MELADDAVILGAAALAKQQTTSNQKRSLSRKQQ